MTESATATQTDDKVLFGLENLTIFPKTGKNTWGTPIPIPGAVDVALNPSGSSSPFYADNTIFYNSISNTGWSGDIEMAKFPDEFYIHCLGWKKDDNGALVEVSDAAAKEFAMAFEVSGDLKGRRVVFYECTATRPATEAHTKEESTTPKTQKSTITAAPVKFPKVTTARTVLPYSEAAKEAWESFYESVYTPVFADVA